MMLLIISALGVLGLVAVLSLLGNPKARIQSREQIEGILADQLNLDKIDDALISSEQEIALVYRAADDFLATVKVLGDCFVARQIDHAHLNSVAVETVSSDQLRLRVTLKDFTFPEFSLLVKSDQAAAIERWQQRLARIAAQQTNQ